MSTSAFLQSYHMKLKRTHHTKQYKLYKMSYNSFAITRLSEGEEKQKKKEKKITGNNRKRMYRKQKISVIRLAFIVVFMQ